MALTVGSRLAHYDVTALIGEGVMGQVYQATDTKLNRDVALKVLPQAFTDDPVSTRQIRARSHSPGLTQPSEHRAHLRAGGSRGAEA